MDWEDSSLPVVTIVTIVTQNILVFIYLMGAIALLMLLGYVKKDRIHQAF
ncbi:hypothetical protein ACEYW6_13785 [Nostoc sp. UIC 10607]